MTRSLLLLVAAGLVAGTIDLGAQAPAAPAQPTLVEVKPNDYGDDKSWLCRPGRKGDACDVDLTTTIVAADGTLTRETFAADPKAPIDCFYVYPTVSTDRSQNSDMTADPAELNVVLQQFARFGSKCRTFAPLYRQMTLMGLQQYLAKGSAAIPFETGLQYDDVRDAWQHYLKNDNQGRGVVLVGHSQGSYILEALIAREIDGKPIQRQLRRRVHPRRDAPDTERPGRRRAVQADSALPQTRTARLRRQLFGIPIDGDASRQHAVWQQPRSRVIGIVHEPRDARTGQRAAACVSVDGR